MKTKSRALLLSIVLSGASAGFAAPAQAHHAHDGVWPYYGLLGLVLLNSYSSHQHSKPRYYHKHRSHYKHRRHYSHGHMRHHRHYDGGKCCGKHKYRRGNWGDD